ncbi:MAG: hypothetical protein A2Y50_01330 [Pseudomonadales bacterium RIFCSPLOWO2_12_59_9]|nr:MAG: hypothetical protein A2Y50_01330 [Pseudomonadales bacterium RIFCSPLOWO2_12_59_9]
MNKKALLIALLTWMAATAANAGTNTWTSGWGMGVSEFLVDDGKGSSLNISCPDDEQGYVSGYATIGEKQYSSAEGAGFDVIVDGKTYSNPLFTDCHACGAGFPEFWKALRKADRLELAADGNVVHLPTKNIAGVLKPLLDPKNTCRSAW